jgi:putative transposase
LKRPPSAHERRDEELQGAIRRSFDDSDQTYGARRVRRDLRAWGQLCGIHRVERLMLAADLQARRKRRRLPFDTGLRAITAIAPNLLDREFQAEAPNQRWVADFTYIWTDEGWLYAAAVLDLFSRMVVGWSMQNQMTARLVSDAMLMAIWRRRPSAELLHHSDQGSQPGFNRSTQRSLRSQSYFKIFIATQCSLTRMRQKSALNAEREAG